jgi:hypothetical protein
MCRAAANDCDLPEYCTGSSAVCPKDEIISSYTGDITWDFLPATTELKITLPICEDDQTSEWVKIRFVQLEEIDSKGFSQPTWPKVDLRLQTFTTRIVPITEAALISEVFTGVNPKNIAQISTSFILNNNPITMVVTVMNIDTESKVLWTDIHGDTRNSTIPANSIKYTIQLSGSWPWVSISNHTLRLGLDVTFSSGNPVLNSGTEIVKLDIVSETMISQLAFPVGNTAPILADGIFRWTGTSIAITGPSAQLSISLPYFNSTVIYDPTVTIINPNPPGSEIDAAVGFSVFWSLLISVVAVQMLF